LQSPKKFDIKKNGGPENRTPYFKD